MFSHAAKPQHKPSHREQEQHEEEEEEDTLVATPTPTPTPRSILNPHRSTRPGQNHKPRPQSNATNPSATKRTKPSSKSILKRKSTRSDRASTPLHLALHRTSLQGYHIESLDKEVGALVKEVKRLKEAVDTLWVRERAERQEKKLQARRYVRARRDSEVSVDIGSVPGSGKVGKKSAG